MKTYDRLHTTASVFYARAWADSDTPAQRKHRLSLDAAGTELHLKAAQAKYKQAAKTAEYKRRTHMTSYLTKSEDGKELYLADFEALGPRWVKDADDIATHQRHKGWYTDDMQGNTLVGVVLCFSRHAAPDENGDTTGKGRQIFMAGTRHSDWDSVTLDLDTTDDMITAARWADGMAERAAAEYREVDEEFQREQKVEEIEEEIVLARKACLKLLRDMRPIRKGLMSLPESVYTALVDQVRNYLDSIKGYRNQLGELT